MKNKKLCALLALTLLLVSLFAGCSSSSVSSSAAPAAAPRADAPQYASEQMVSNEMAMVEKSADSIAMGSRTGSTQTAAPPVRDDRKIIRTAYLTLETKEFDTALSSLATLIAEHGGYLESQSENGRSFYAGDYYSRQASLTARIPAEKLDAVISATEGLCNITSRSIQAADVTESYFDSTARLQSLELQEERLLDILSKAQKLDEVITLEQALMDVRYQIESLTASLRRLDSQVAYSTLNLELSEVVNYQEPIAQPKSLTERLSAAWTRSCQRIADTAESLLLFSIESLPSLLLFVGLPLLLVLLLVRRSLKKRGQKKQSQPTPSIPAEKPAPSTLEEK